MSLQWAVLKGLQGLRSRIPEVCYNPEKQLPLVGPERCAWYRDIGLVLCTPGICHVEEQYRFVDKSCTINFPEGVNLLNFLVKTRFESLEKHQRMGIAAKHRRWGLLKCNMMNLHMLFTSQLQLIRTRAQGHKRSLGLIIPGGVCIFLLWCLITLPFLLPSAPHG